MGQSHYGCLAQADRFDEALFVGPDGVISEGSITNIGFIHRDSIIWPDAPALRGVMMQVLQRELDQTGVAWRYEAVHVADLASLAGAFVTNSHGMARSRASTIGGCRRRRDSYKSEKQLLAAAPYDPN